MRCINVIFLPFISEKESNVIPDRLAHFIDIGIVNLYFCIKVSRISSESRIFLQYHIVMSKCYASGQGKMVD